MNDSSFYYGPGVYGVKFFHHTGIIDHIRSRYLTTMISVNATAELILCGPSRLLGDLCVLKNSFLPQRTKRVLRAAEKNIKLEVMKWTFFVFLMLWLVHLSAQSTVKGLVTEQNSGNKPLPGVQIKALGTTPEQTGNDGLFQLVFTSKKAGDRIIVSEITKKGYEIVNKDVVNNWVITNNPNDKTKIVMCPEGLIAQNTLKYYDISLEGLSRGYQERIKVLQERQAKTEIDAKTYGEQAKILAEQYEKQQKQLEELAEKFARENFDDCSAIHREAFEAFKAGNIPEAIRILERVNSAEEFTRAQAQKEKGKRVEREGKMMQSESDSIIRQNIAKLMFQADLYKSQFRFADAEKAYETALMADTTNLDNIFPYVSYLIDMFKTEEAARWNKTAMNQADQDHEKARALFNLGLIYLNMKHFPEAGTAFSDAVSISRRMADADPRYIQTLSYALGNLAEYYSEIKQEEKAMEYHRESIQFVRELVKIYPDRQKPELARHLMNLALCQANMNLTDSAKANYSEALGLYKELEAREPNVDWYKFGLAWSLMGLAKLCSPDTAEVYYSKAADLLRGISKHNNQQWGYFLARLLTAYAQMKVRQRAFGEAKALYTEALKITEYFMKVNPVEFNFVHAIVLTTLASVEEDMNDFENAQVHYDKAINIWTQLVQDNPDIYAIDMAQMLLTRAYMYYRLKDFEKTDHDYREAFNLLRGLQKAEPDETTRMLTISLNTYARLLYEIKEPEKAVPVFEECLYWAEKSDARIDADQRGAAYLYGDYAFIQLQHKQFMLAERSSRRGLELDSTQTWIYTNLALALLFQDRYDEALKIYRRWKDRPYPNPPLPTFREAFLKDFDDMENLGITHPDVAKVRELLKQ